MNMDAVFFLNSILLGVGLAMDAFSVSLANGLNDPGMKPSKTGGIAGMFTFFQALMPMLGWICVHTVMEKFQTFEKFIPWIALALLGWIGGKMLWEGLQNRKDHRSDADVQKLTFSALFLQGVATSIDALSVGFTIAEYQWFTALICSLIIAAVTFGICTAGLIIGKKFGTRFSDKASVLGGVILICIGIEIFVSGLLG